MPVILAFHYKFDLFILAFKDIDHICEEFSGLAFDLELLVVFPGMRGYL